MLSLSDQIERNFQRAKWGDDAPMGSDGKLLKINDRVINDFGNVRLVGRGFDEHGYLACYTEDGYLRWEHPSGLRHVGEAA